MIPSDYIHECHHASLGLFVANGGVKIIMRGAHHTYHKPRPLINKDPPLNRDYNRDPNIKARKRRGFLIRGLHHPLCFLFT